jgi:hypothetical protein
MTNAYLLIICGFIFGTLAAIAGLDSDGRGTASVPDLAAKVVFAAVSAMIMPENTAVDADRVDEPAAATALPK